MDEAAIRKLRDKGIWVRYDSIVVGPGASAIQGWHDDFESFANSEELRFLDGSRTEGTAGRTYCNISGDTEDWAQDIYATRVEYISPFGIQALEANAFDAAVGPFYWSQELPQRSNFLVQLADADTYLKVPGSFLPGNTGVTGTVAQGGATQFSLPGVTGEANLTAGWVWPQPLKVPAKGKIAMSMRIGTPLRQMFQQLGGLPQQKVIPIVNGNDLRVVAVPNWFAIRVSCWGPRYLQLRGARSS